jgi:serine/threonine-protein kinase
MLSEVAGELVVKVLDFGIALVHDSSLTGTGRALGTPAYMSPEQCQSAPLDGRSDLYSLGIILYRCVAGRTPFSDPNPLSLMFSHAVHAPPPLESATQTAISRDFARLVHRALAKSPAERFADARAMRAELEALRALGPDQGEWIDATANTEAWVPIRPAVVAADLTPGASVPGLSATPGGGLTGRAPASPLTPASSLALAQVTRAYPGNQAVASAPVAAALPAAGQSVAPAKGGVPWPWLLAIVSVAVAGTVWLVRPAAPSAAPSAIAQVAPQPGAASAQPALPLVATSPAALQRAPSPVAAIAPRPDLDVEAAPLPTSATPAVAKHPSSPAAAVPPTAAPSPPPPRAKAAAPRRKAKSRGSNDLSLPD